MDKANLAEIEGRGPIKALGMMSGTSLDGVDAAIVTTDGETISGFGAHGYRAYSPQHRDVLRAALGKWDGPEISAAAGVVEDVHQDLLATFEPVDLVGFHGQTVAHDPARGRTLQIGDGAKLAGVLNTPVVWDFRSEDVALGGEGAPLAPFFHFACARMIGAKTPLCFLNLGGVGNLTYVDPRYERPEDPGALLAFDTGPANAPINDMMQARLGLELDRDGAVAAAGQISQDAVDTFLTDPFFARLPPKSLDRNDFPGMSALVEGLGDSDAIATLTAMSAAAVRQSVTYCPEPPSHVLITGGGRLNPELMRHLREGLGCPVDPVEAVGLDGDMLEAQAFAYLAVRVARGLPTSCPKTTGAPHPVCGGRISRP